MRKLFTGLTFAFSMVQIVVVAQVCPPTPGTELVTNGDFSSGNTDFSSNLTYDATANLDGDHYTVTTNPNPWNSGYFKSMGDHTTGTGNMLIFDFNSSSTNDPIYKYTLNVNTGQTYFFSAWFANIAINNYTACGTCPGGQYITNSPQLQFRIVAGTGGPSFTSPTVYVDSLSNNWNQYFTAYTATTTGTIEIQVLNLRGGNGSNDLAIDDISFSNGCDKISDLNSLGQSSGLPDEVYNCNVAFPYDLDPGLPGSYIYTWKTDAVTTVGTGTTYSVASTPADGTEYYLCYEYIPGCPRTDTVTFRNTPISVEIGTDKELCDPVNYTISSGISTPPATVQWFKDGVAIGGATNSDYTATDAGTYRVEVSRPGCGSALDEMTITNPVSSFSGAGTYCTSPDEAEFSVTSGTTQVKWYDVPTGGSPLNPGNSDATISLPYSSTVTSEPGCSSGLYAEDISSYPGALMPTAPCANSGNTTSELALRLDISQTATLTSVDFYHGSGWGATGNFTFKIYNNNPTGGPWCGSCTPGGTYDGLGAVVLYTETTPSYTVGGSPTVRTLTLATPQVLSPGQYWLSIVGNGTPVNGFQGCAASKNTVDLWNTPIADNTGNNVMIANKALDNGNGNGMGGLFNIQFQVGSSNTCSRLFICATENCPSPVDFLTFNASRKSNGNLLVWKTASESNSAYFLVQRSADGINFETIGSVKAAGYSQEIVSYTFLDGTDLTQVYYRLKQVDIDEAFEYSNIVYLSNEKSGVLSGIYPVPVKGGNDLYIDYLSDSDEAVSVQVYDNLGRLLISDRYTVASGTNTIAIGTTGFSAGCYYLQINGNTLETKKFLVE